MRKNNKGVTLVELVAVIAIMAVLVGGGGVVFGLLSDNAAKECASNLDTYLSQYRIKAMSAPGSEGLELYKEASDNSYYIKLPGDTKGNKIGASRVNIQYYESDMPSAVPKDISTTMPLKLSINRSSGAYNPLSANTYCQKITITQGKYVYVIQFVPETGRHSVRQEVK